MATKLILIRHGITDWNLEKRYCGRRDIKLNAEGKQQARLLERRLKEEKIQGVYASDRMRAMQTAKIIFKGLKIKKAPGLREISFGSFEGSTCAEIMRETPGIYKRWLKDPFKINIPKGERLNNFKKRVVTTFKEIISLNPGKTIAVVCHGGVLSIFINEILKKRKLFRYIPPPASISILEYKNNKPKILLLNDISHLSKKE